MIPVVGLPGLPVGNALDIITVYIGKGLFKDCRSPDSNYPIMNLNGVIHFTATRKTMQDIIDKHKDSGHYDDPDYDFDNWIKNILPRIHVGMKNVHMYKKYQIWPFVRKFSNWELYMIPNNLHKYISK
jgi:hypothetical protein